MADTKQDKADQKARAEAVEAAKLNTPAEREKAQDAAAADRGLEHAERPANGGDTTPPGATNPNAVQVGTPPGDAQPATQPQVAEGDGRHIRPTSVLEGQLDVEPVAPDAAKTLLHMPELAAALGGGLLPDATARRADELAHEMVKQFVGWAKEGVSIAVVRMAFDSAVNMIEGARVAARDLDQPDPFPGIR